MNNKNKILVGCLTLLLVLSVGYALFSETITINGTATAKGDFDTTTTCTPGISEELVLLGLANSSDDEQSGFENSICNVNNNIVTMTTDLLYPTASRFFTVKMTNTGSIPAIIWGYSTSNKVESLDIWDSYSYSIINKNTGETLSSGNGDVIRNDTNYGGDYRDSTVVLWSNKENEFFSEDNLIKNTEKNIGGIKLEQGDSIFVIIKFNYGESVARALNNNGQDEYFEFKLNHEFEWEQYTNNSNYESASLDDFCFNGC